MLQPLTDEPVHSEETLLLLLKRMMKVYLTNRPDIETVLLEPSVEPLLSESKTFIKSPADNSNQFTVKDKDVPVRPFADRHKDVMDLITVASKSR